jgi:nucleolar complex protein 3
MSDYDINSEDDLVFDSDEELGSEDDAEGSGSPVLDEDDDDLGSDLSEGEEEGQDEFNVAYDEDGMGDSESDEEDEGVQPRKRKGKDEEAEYELSGRSRWTKKADPSNGAEADSVEVGRLPIKLPTGEIQMVAGSTRIALPPSKKKPLPEISDEEEEEEEEEEEGSDDEKDAHKMAGQKGRFGRMGIAEIVGKQEWKNAQKLEAAKEQVAAIGAEILAGGELIDNVSGPRHTPRRRYQCYVPRIGSNRVESSRIVVLISHRDHCSRASLHSHSIPSRHLKRATLPLPCPPRFEASPSSPSWQCTKISFQATASDSSPRPRSLRRSVTRCGGYERGRRCW